MTGGHGPSWEPTPDLEGSKHSAQHWKKHFALPLLHRLKRAQLFLKHVKQRDKRLEMQLWKQTLFVKTIPGTIGSPAEITVKAQSSSVHDLEL